MKELVRAASAAAFAALAAGAFIVLPSFSDRVDASAPITVSAAAAPGATGKCAEQHWPYMDADCLRDTRKAEGHAKPAARVVNIDRRMAAE